MYDNTKLFLDGIAGVEKEKCRHFDRTATTKKPKITSFSLQEPTTQKMKHLSIYFNNYLTNKL